MLRLSRLLTTPVRCYFNCRAPVRLASSALPSNSDREGFMMRSLRRARLLPHHITVSEETAPRLNRFRFIVPSVITHLALGSIYAWSMFNQPLTRLTGVVAPAAGDWALSDTSVVFTLVMGGFAFGALLSSTQDRVGPRASVLAGALSLGSGFTLASVAAATGSLPILYAGGLVWGLANGWAYVPPVAALLRWFPDRKGFASSSCIVGFGGGAMIAAPLFTRLIEHFRVAPTWLGSADSVATSAVDGRLFAEVGGSLREVVVATAADLRSWDQLSEGIYLVGSGDTGIVGSFAVLAGLYASAMVASAYAFRLPPAGFVPNSLPAQTPTDDAAVSSKGSVASPSASLTAFNVDAAQAMRIPQFWGMLGGLALFNAGAYGIVSTGHTMLVDAFGTTMPTVVNAAVAAAFVSTMSAGNLGGRLLWSNASDALAKRIGDPFRARRLTYMAMWGASPVLYLTALASIHASVAAAEGATAYPPMLPLAVFFGSVTAIVGCFGGSAALWPALIGDTYGLRHVGTITARTLVAVLPAAILGPSLAAGVRESSLKNACVSLTDKLDDATFHAAFSLPKDQLPLLIEQKTVTVSRLMELVPPGTPNPTPFVYDDLMIIMAGICGTAFVSMALLRPVAAKYHSKT